MMASLSRFEGIELVSRSRRAGLAAGAGLIYLKERQWIIIEPSIQLGEEI